MNYASLSGKGVMKFRWLSDILVLTLVVYFGVSAVMSVLAVKIAPKPLGDFVQKKIKENSSGAARPLEQYAVIAERNLFGSGPGALAAPAQEKDELGEIPVAVDSLGLKLVGTVVSGAPDKSIAIIEDRSSRKQEAYHQGDRIRQILIKRILRHNVIINAGSRDEVLTMKPEEGAGPAEPPTPSAKSEPPPTTAGSIRLKREEIESSMADLNQLMQEVRIRPYLEGGRPSGFLVSNIKSGSFFSKLGLRNGDIIRRVNEQTITGPDQAMEFYQSLMEGEELSLEIKRGRRQQRLVYDIE